MSDYLEVWITARAAARILVVHPRSVPRIAAVSAIRRRILPGVHPRYHRGDVERAMREAIGPADAGMLAAKRTARPGGRSRGRAATAV